MTATQKRTMMMKKRTMTMRRGVGAKMKDLKTRKEGMNTF